MAKFTKGPWKATRTAPFSYEIVTDHPRNHRNYGVIVQEVRCQENAELIAAAPEMFLALERICAEAESWHSVHGHEQNSTQCDSICQLIPEMRRALNKAKGESRG